MVVVADEVRLVPDLVARDASPVAAGDRTDVLAPPPEVARRHARAGALPDAGSGRVGGGPGRGLAEDEQRREPLGQRRPRRRRRAAPSSTRPGAGSRSAHVVPVSHRRMLANSWPRVRPAGAAARARAAREVRRRVRPRGWMLGTSGAATGWRRGRAGRWADHGAPAAGGQLGEGRLRRGLRRHGLLLRRRLLGHGLLLGSRLLGRSPLHRWLLRGRLRLGSSLLLGSRLLGGGHSSWRPQPSSRPQLFVAAASSRQASAPATRRQWRPRRGTAGDGARAVAGAGRRAGQGLGGGARRPGGAGEGEGTASAASAPVCTPREELGAGTTRQWHVELPEAGGAESRLDAYSSAPRPPLRGARSGAPRSGSRRRTRLLVLRLRRVLLEVAPCPGAGSWTSSGKQGARRAARRR